MLNSMTGYSRGMNLSASIFFKWGIIIIAFLTVSSCSSVHEIVPESVSNVLPGKNVEEILPGERRSVLSSSQSLSVDPDASRIPVNIPQAFVNLDWPQPGGRPSNSFEHLALSKQPKRLWSVSAGRGSSNDGRLTASPIVVGKFVFVLDTRATVHAFSTANGAALWTAELTPKGEEDDEGFGGGLASEGNLLFAASGFGTVSALDPATGQKKWTKALEVPIRSAPTAKDGRIYVTTVSNEVFALSASDGEIVWKFRGVSESAGLLSNTSPAIDGGYVVVPYTSGDLVAFRESDGGPVWTDSLSKTGRLSSLAQLNDIAGRPVIFGGQVYAISHGGRFASLDLKSGKRLWDRDITGVQTPWVAGGHVFVVNLDNQVMALSRTDGKVRWIVSLNDAVEGGKARGQWSGPVLAGGRLWLVSSKGLVVTLAPQSGERLGSFSLGDGMFIPPIVANNTIYFLTDDADLIAMR